MGALGWVGHATTLDLGLTIRTVAVDGDRLHLWAGGGITWDSDPAAEVAEAAAKAAPIRPPWPPDPHGRGGGQGFASDLALHLRPCRRSRSAGPR